MTEEGQVPSLAGRQPFPETSACHQTIFPTILNLQFKLDHISPQASSPPEWSQLEEGGERV